MKKNILFIDRRIGFNRGGGEMVNLSLAKELAKLGYNILFLIGSNKNNKINIPFTEFPFYLVSSFYLVDFWQKIPFPFSVLINYLDIFLFKKVVVKEIEFIIKKENIEVIQLLGMPSLAYSLQKKFSKIQIITQFPGPPGKFIYYNQTKKLNNLFAPGDAFKKLKKINHKAVHIPNGVNGNDFIYKNEYQNFLRKKFKIANDKRIILTVGRLVPLKNYPFLIKILKQLKEKRTDFICFIIGTGPLQDKIRKLIDTNNLNENVKLLGAIEHKILPKYFYSADIFLLTSSYENSPLVVIEAMNCKLPVIASDVGGVDEFVVNGQTGFLVKNKKLSKYIFYIEKLMNNREIRNKFGINAKNKIKKYTWQYSAKLFEQYFLNK